MLFVNVNVSFRDVDERKFREFKSIVVREGLKNSEALNKAFDLFIESFKSKPKKHFSLSGLKPENWGPGSENDSSRVDEIVYGWTH